MCFAIHGFCKVMQVINVALLTTTQQKNKNFTHQVDKESDLESDYDDKVSRIAVLAYYKAEARGYEPGHEMQDWLEAEAEIEGKVEKV